MVSSSTMALVLLWVFGLSVLSSIALELDGTVSTVVNFESSTGDVTPKVLATAGGFKLVEVSTGNVSPTAVTLNGGFVLANVLTSADDFVGFNFSGIFSVIFSTISGFLLSSLVVVLSAVILTVICGALVTLKRSLPSSSS